MKILMVCLGNICRSPLAQGIMEKNIAEGQLNWQVDSAGTSAWHAGEKPDHRSRVKALEYGMDISNQRARQFEREDFSKFDSILVMDTSNFRDVIKLARNDREKSKVEMILNYAFPNENRSLPDPYYDNSFEESYQLLNKACKCFLREHLALAH